MNAAKIAELNDQFRRHGVGNGRAMVTRSVHDLGPVFELTALLRVQRFNAFTADNDPHGEHDFGSFELEGEKLFWKIDYYDLKAEFGSEDPTDPKKMLRVLTVMSLRSTDLLLPAPRSPRGAFFRTKCRRRGVKGHYFIFASPRFHSVSGTASLATRSCW